MYLGLDQPLFYIASVWFIIAVFISWLLPGWLVLHKLKMKSAVLTLLLALPIGMALWGIQGYFFGYLGTRWMSFIYLVMTTFFFVRECRNSFHPFLRQVVASIQRQPAWFWLTVAVSTAVQLFAHLPSGLTDAEGLKMYFVNAVDGVMHLGYIESIKMAFPPMEPGAVGYQLVNYHYWSDLILAELSRIWGLPSMHLFFQWVPLLLTVWTLLMIAQVVLKLGGTRRTMAIVFFLLTLGGDAAYLFTQLLHGNWGENVSSLDSGVTFIFNFPQVVARTTFIAGLLLLLEWWQSKKTSFGLVAGVVIATLFGFKVYYGLYAILGLGSLLTLEAVVTFTQHLKKHSFFRATVTTLKAQRPAVMIVSVIAVVGLSIYLPVNIGAGGLTYSPLEWPRLLLSADNIHFRDWALRMQVYEAYGNTRNILVLNALAVVMTFVAVYGTRMLGFLPLTFPFTGLGRKIWFFFVPANGIFILLGLFTLQTSGGLNVFNFLIVPILSFTLFSAFILTKLPSKIFLPIFLIFIALTLPRSLLQLKHFYTRYSQQTPDLKLSYDQLAAFEYLRTETPLDSVVQAPPTNGHDQLTPYVAYFSHRPSFIAGISMLESHNQPTKNRQQQLKDAFTHSTFSSKRDALDELGIDYLYLSRSEYTTSGFIPSDVVFEKPEVVVVRLP